MVEEEDGGFGVARDTGEKKREEEDVFVTDRWVVSGVSRTTRKYKVWILRSVRFNLVPQTKTHTRFYGSKIPNIRERCSNVFGSRAK